MSTISDDNKAIARHVAKSFGGKPSVREYLHDNLPLKIDILSAEDQPDAGITSYGTIGLSGTPLKWGDGEFKTRIELCGSARSEKTLFPNMLASAAFNIMRSQILCHPGSAMRNYFREYYEDTNVPHLYFTSPFVWDDLKTLIISKINVTWLLCFPISEAELDFLNSEGDDKFEDLLESVGVDVFDIDRDSAL